MENKIFIGITIILASCIIAVAVIFGFKSKIKSEESVAIMGYRDKFRDECEVSRKSNCDAWFSLTSNCLARGGGVAQINECSQEVENDPSVKNIKNSCMVFSIENCIDNKMKLIQEKEN